MPQRSLHDTRFFVEYFYSENSDLLRKLREDLRSTRERLVSVVTIHEMHRIDLENEGKEVAAMRSETVRRDFEVLEIDYEIAVKSAALRSLHRIPMADSLIAATAEFRKSPVVSDDPHFQRIESIKTLWYTTSD